MAPNEQVGEEYGYPSGMRSQIKGLQVAGIVCISLVTLWVGWHVGRIPAEFERPETLGLLLALGLVLVIGWMVGLYLINLFPTIWITEQYLVLSKFPKGYISIPWQDVIETTKCSPLRYCFGSTLVRAHRITLWHRFYGLQYTGSIQPVFLIHPSIDRHDELLEEIRRRITER